MAEICSRYHPNDIHMPGFQNGHNTCVKVDNWKQLQRFFATRELAVPAPLVEGVMKGLHGSAVEMVELLYEIFTGKRVQQMPVIEVEVRACGCVCVYGCACVRVCWVRRAPCGAAPVGCQRERSVATEALCPYRLSSI